MRRQDIGYRSHIFSFGIILYEMLSGQRTFTGESQVEVMNVILKEDPPELSSTMISPALDKIVWRCLGKKPEMKFTCNVSCLDWQVADFKEWRHQPTVAGRW